MLRTEGFDVFNKIILFTESGKKTRECSLDYYFLLILQIGWTFLFVSLLLCFFFFFLQICHLLLPIKKIRLVSMCVRKERKLSATFDSQINFCFSDAHAMESSYHMSFVGNNNGINERTKQSQKLLHYCPKCLRSFTLKSNRNRHLRYECGYEPRFKCPYCDLRSKQTSHIYCHIRKKHPAEKVFVVDLKS